MTAYKSTEKQRAYWKAYKESHKERYAENVKAYRESHGDEIASRNHAYYKKHRKELLLRQAAYYAANRDEILSRVKVHYETHREDELARMKTYRRLNRDTLAAQKREYRKTHKAEVAANCKVYYESCKKEAVCPECGKFTKVKERFCSLKCSHAWHVGQHATNWQGGISFEPYCPKFNANLRQRIRAFFDFECMMCGKSTEENGQGLSCHHVEYNKQACCDGMPVQFAALCARCHNKTTSSSDRQRWEDMLHRIINEVFEGKSYFTKDEYESFVSELHE